MNASAAFLCEGAHAIIIIPLWKTIAQKYHGRLDQITRVFGDMLLITCAFFIIATNPYRFNICDRFWENPYKRGKYHYSISSVLVISLIFVKIFFIMKMDVWNIVLGSGKDIRSGTHYNSRSKPKTLAGRDSTSRSC